MRRTTLVLLLAALAATGALTAPAHGSTPASDECWARVINDWAKDRKIAASYRIRCYTDAIANAPDDVRSYSTFVNDTRKARRRAIQRCTAHLGKGNPACGIHGNGRTSPDFDCWRRVIQDWIPDGQIRPTYKVRCYSDALTNAPADLLAHGSFARDVRNARARAIADCTRRNGPAAPACKP
ncbi:MAG: hypothetical protein R3C15_02005 [Thermoleophilia bacterium]